MTLEVPKEKKTAVTIGSNALVQQKHNKLAAMTTS